MIEKFFAQKKDGWCGVSALSFAMAMQEVFVTQERLAKETGTSVTKGVDPEPLMQSARKRGFVVKTYEGDDAEETLQELQKHRDNGDSVIVDYLAGNTEDDGHYVVFLGNKTKKIEIWNPSGGEVMTLDKDYFISHWKDRKENGKLMKHWSMILKKTK